MISTSKIPQIAFALFFLLWSSFFLSQSLMDGAAILLFLTALFLVLRDSSARRDAFSRKIFWFLLAWWGWVGFGYVLNGNFSPRAISGFLEFRWCLEWLLWCALLNRILATRDLGWPWWATTPLISGVIGLPLILMTAPSDWAGFRNGGILQEPMSFAHNVGPAALILCGFALCERRFSWKPVFAALLLLVMVLTTQTRGVWVGAWLGLITVILLSGRKDRLRLAFALVGATVLLAISPPVWQRLSQSFDPARSYDSERMVLWKANGRMFLDNPVAGVGYGLNNSHLREYYDRMGLPAGQFEGHAHNQYLNILAGTGLIGLLFYLAFIGYFLVETWRMMKREDRFRGLLLGLFGAQICFHIAAWTESSFAIAKNRTMILFLFAVISAIRFARGKAAAR